MPRYEVYATRWDDPHIVEELIPAKGLEFTLPLSDHGECTFTAVVEPGRSFWRQSIAPVVSGLLITRDDVPVWSGYVWDEVQETARGFRFTCAEWGSFFERCLPEPATYTNTNDHAIFASLVTRAQNIPGQAVGVTVPASAGAAFSDLTVNAWDTASVEELFRQVGDAEGGPEWAFVAAGTLDEPARVLLLADRMGRTIPDVVLEYVEATDTYRPPRTPPKLTTLGNLFPGQEAQAVVGLRGGNVIAHPARHRDGTTSATRVVAVGAGEEASQLRAERSADSLLAAGYPRLSLATSYPDVSVTSTLQRHADADLAQRSGLLTSYTLTAWDGDPDWTQMQRGDAVRMILDTDAYGGQRPVEADLRLLQIAVKVPDAGTAQVNYTVADRLEVA